MASISAEARHEWRQLKDDPPGQRFQNHRERMRHGSRVLACGRAVLGVVLLASGVLFLFIPGPGLLVMAFGLALFAGMSSRLARSMDRAEPVIRRWVDALQSRWHRLPTVGKAGVIAVAVAIAGAFAYGMYRYWFA